VRVAAAADLAIAFKEVGAAFERASGKKVEFSFGSTGLLAKQIAEGAPFDVFAAANISYVDEVVRAAACDGATKKLYAKGRIVMWSTDKAQLPASLDDLKDAKYAKVAIANPEHAPYGLAARQAMTKAGVWQTVEPRAVFGENVQQTLMYAQSGKESPNFGFNSAQATESISSRTVRSSSCFLQVETNPLRHRMLSKLSILRETFRRDS
jgi:molybdate transport system substrate-binding protein